MKNNNKDSNIINNALSKYGKTNKIDTATELELQEVLRNIRVKLNNGTATQMELVDAYMKLTSPHMSDKQKIKMRVRLLKVKKETLEYLLRKGIDAVDNK